MRRQTSLNPFNRHAAPRPERLRQKILDHWYDGTGRADPHYTQRMIDKGADIRAADPDTGYTLLHQAASRGLALEMRMLIKAGADIDARDNQNETPLFHCTGRGRGRNETCTDILIEAGADLNVQNDLGVTPLHQAINYNMKETAFRMLDKGARFDIQNRVGQTALDLATRGKHKKSTEIMTRMHDILHAAKERAALAEQQEQERRRHIEQGLPTLGPVTLPPRLRIRRKGAP